MGCWWSKAAGSSTRLPPIRAYMDDYIVTLTTTAPCSCQLLIKLNDRLKWARMKVKPSKYRSVSISKGKLVEERLNSEGEVIPYIVEKAVKSFCWWYISLLSNRGQVSELR